MSRPPTPVAVWQDGGSSPGNHVNTRDIPLLLKCDVIAAARNSCLSVGYLATLRCVTQERVDMSQYIYIYISEYICCLKVNSIPIYVLCSLDTFPLQFCMHFSIGGKEFLYNSHCYFYWYFCFCLLLPPALMLLQYCCYYSKYLR
jgi:hypothetical protein